MRRLKGLYIHYLYSMRRNPARIIEILIWPSFEALLFGLLASSEAAGSSQATNITLVILTGIVYWNCTARIIQESAAQFIDDFTSKNIQNLLLAPISLGQLILATTAASMTKIILSLVALMLILRAVFPAFFSTLGFHALLWVFQLELFGVSLSLVAIALVFLFGERASFSGWMLSTVVQIVSLVFYNRAALPQPLYAMSFLTPSSYVFEAIRQYSPGSQIFTQSQLNALLLSIVYLFAGSVLVAIASRVAKHIGTLTKL